VSGYLRQQRGYGKAEALLERKHPDKYSATGHVAWAGQLYGNGAAQHRGGWRWRVYYGGWGTAPYQSIYGPRHGLLESLPLMPEWYLAIGVLGLVSAAGAAWGPLLFALPLLGLALLAVVADAALGAARARFVPQRGIWRLRLLTGALYLAQPLARLYGRTRYGLTPWRRRGPRLPALPRPRSYSSWCEQWAGTEERVRTLTQTLGDLGAVVRSGGDWDRWDLQVRGGLLASARLRLAIEEHGAGNQLVRVRTWPRVRWELLGLCAALVGLAALAAASNGGAATIVLVTLAAALAGRMLYECGLASAAVRQAVAHAFAPQAHNRVVARLPAPQAPLRRSPHPRSPGVRDAAR
jgi:hypothetical protein